MAGVIRSVTQADKGNRNLPVYAQIPVLLQRLSGNYAAEVSVDKLSIQQALESAQERTPLERVPTPPDRVADQRLRRRTGSIEFISERSLSATGTTTKTGRQRGWSFGETDVGLLQTSKKRQQHLQSTPRGHKSMEHYSGAPHTQPTATLDSLQRSTDYVEENCTANKATALAGFS